MVTTKSRGKLLILAILSFILLLGLINFLVLTSQRTFNLELLGFFLLLFLMLLGFVGYARSWGERFFFFFFLFYLINLVAIWYFFGSLYFVLLLLAAFGFLLSAPRRGSECIAVREEIPNLSNEPSGPVDQSITPVIPVTTVTNPPEKIVEKKVATNHSPGKFVASKRSNIYHAPKCDWAKKIGKERRVWFPSKEDAWEQGYKAHGCAK